MSDETWPQDFLKIRQMCRDDLLVALVEESPSKAGGGEAHDGAAWLAFLLLAADHACMVQADGERRFGAAIA